MTLTTLGLSLRDETLVKSMLSVVGAQTHAEWRFVDEIDADLVLCDRDSPLARLGMQRFEREGRPLCVTLGGSRDVADATGLRSIRTPLRVREFIELLDAISDPGRPSATRVDACADREVAHANVPSSPQPPGQRGRTLADAVRACAAESDASSPPGVWRIGIGGHFLDALFPERRFVSSSAELTMDALVDLAVSVRVDSMVRIERTEIHAPHLAKAARSLDQLLWRLGLRMPWDAATPWLADDVVLRLSRWPDFGHLGGHRGHLALAALMARTSWRPADLIEASGQTRAELHSFLGACALCGLLLVEKAAPSASVPQTPNRHMGVSGLFRSLRNALRIGV